MGLSIGQIPSGLLNQGASVFAPPPRAQRSVLSPPERPSVLTSLNRNDSGLAAFFQRDEDEPRFGLGRRVATLSTPGAAFTTLRLGVQSVRELTPSLQERQEQLRVRLAEARANPPAVEVRQAEDVEETEEDQQDQFPFETDGEEGPVSNGEAGRALETARAPVGLGLEGGVPRLGLTAPEGPEFSLTQERDASPTFSEARVGGQPAPASAGQAAFQFQGQTFTFTSAEPPDREGFTPQGLRPRLDVTV